MPAPTSRVTKRRRGRLPRSLELWVVVGLVALVGAYFGVLELSRPHVGGTRLRYDTFSQYVKQGRIRDARILDEDAYVVGHYTRANGTTGQFSAALARSTQGDVINMLVNYQVPTTVDQQVGKRVVTLASVLLPGLLLVLLFTYLILSYRRGSGLFRVKSGARSIASEHSSVTFADVAGQDAAVTELREVSTFLAQPERFADVGATIPKGILLFGPPGSGKTMLARALANEAHASFFSISGSDFVEIYAGVGAARVRDLFSEARNHAPAVIFIDELDSIGRARSTGVSSPSHDEQEQALNQILAEMDGFEPWDGTIVVGATNRPDVLDPALLRPGRFDRTVGLERPDEAARLAILGVHARGKRLAGDVDLAAIALRAVGLTGADLASVMNEGALLAVRAGRDMVLQGDLQLALKRILDAPERQRRLSMREKRVGTRFSSDERVTFADVAGAGDAIAELAEVHAYLADPEHMVRLGARAPRGILLSGPPGCGKTLLARAVAGEANAAFVSVAASEFVEKWVGEGAARVRDLFAEARSLAPAIVFVDEIDAVGAERGRGSVDGHREREQTLNQILVELDGFDKNEAVIVVAATNRPDILDPALIRPGRFDRHVTVALPDRAGRRAILELHADGKRLAPDVDFEIVAGLTRGLSGADLANVLNEAALLAARRGLSLIPLTVVEEAIDRAAVGISSRAVRMTDAEQALVAYHEAGHALVARRLPAPSSPHKLTIVSAGGSLGHCMVAEAADRVVSTRSALLDQMATILGGRAAEELVFGEPSSAAANDVQRATALAASMVVELGMSPGRGPVAYGADRDRLAPPAELDAEVRRLVDEAFRRALEILTGNRRVLDRTARALADRETLTAADLDALDRHEVAPA